MEAVGPDELFAAFRDLRYYFYYFIWQRSRMTLDVFEWKWELSRRVVSAGLSFWDVLGWNEKFWYKGIFLKQTGWKETRIVQQSRGAVKGNRLIETVSQVRSVWQLYNEMPQLPLRVFKTEHFQIRRISLCSDMSSIHHSTYSVNNFNKAPYQ